MNFFPASTIVCTLGEGITGTFAGWLCSDINGIQAVYYDADGHLAVTGNYTVGAS